MCSFREHLTSSILANKIKILLVFCFGKLDEIFCKVVWRHKRNKGKLSLLKHVYKLRLTYQVLTEINCAIPSMMKHT